MSQIKVLVVDDSLLMQKVISDILQADTQISVIGTARDGREALSKVASLHPDVVTMDIEMPFMNGLTATRKIMETEPTPVVMISALTQREANITLKALEFGAIDYLPKPAGHISLNMDSVGQELISKIKTAAQAKVMKPTFQQNPEQQTPEEKFEMRSCDKIIGIAASTGGPQALTRVLVKLPHNIPPTLIVQHMPEGFTRIFAERLGQTCRFGVKEAEEGDKLSEGLALIAPGNFHMRVTGGDRIHLSKDAPVNFVRPSADPTLISVAEMFGPKAIGVILTGMGNDGAKGIAAIKQKGGQTIAQDEKTSVVFGMPKAAIATGCVDIVSPLERVPEEIVRICEPAHAVSCL
jgi:two-component system chemotaxis response regulator CheB